MPGSIINSNSFTLFLNVTRSIHYENPFNRVIREKKLSTCHTQLKLESLKGKRGSIGVAVVAC